MKRMMRSLLITVLIFAVCLAAQGCRRWFLENPANIGRTDEGGHDGKTTAEIDLEHLEYYGLEMFSTRLPVVFIDTQGQQIEKENKIWARMGILDAKPEGRSVTDTPDTVEAVTIGMRGASSYRFDKKQYRIKFYAEQGKDREKPYGFLGMKPDSEWVLNGPYLDKTLMRNRLMYQLAGEIFEWSSDTRYCELFVNGRYQGLYLAVEPVTAGVNRLNISRYGLMSGETAYLVKRDRIGSEDNPLETYGEVNGKVNNSLYIEYPAAKNITDSQRKWVAEDISRLEYCLYGDTSGYPLPEYRQYIDLDSFADYFIFNETVMNYDAGNLSTYIYKDLQGKLKTAVWDYNNSYDNYQWFALAVNEWYTVNNTWFHQMIKDRAFVERVVERYHELRQGVLREEHMYELIGGYEKELGEAVERNFAVWGYTFAENLTNDAEREIRSYEAAIGQLKRMIQERLDFMDGHINDLYEYCEDKKY